MDNLGSITASDYQSVIGQTMTSGLEGNLNKVNKNKATDEEMMAACKEFEAYMIEQVYKQMEKTVMKADEKENDYMSYFSDLRIQQYAKVASDQGTIGLAQQLYEAMKRNQGIE